jgi:hypothetical protein
MTHAPVSPTRRAVLRTITTIVAVAASAVLAGTSTSTSTSTSTTPTPGVHAGGAPSTRPTPGATAGGVAPSTLVMVIRHGEKPDDSHPGVDAQGNQGRRHNPGAQRLTNRKITRYTTPADLTRPRRTRCDVARCHRVSSAPDTTSGGSHRQNQHAGRITTRTYGNDEPTGTKHDSKSATASCMVRNREEIT